MISLDTRGIGDSNKRRKTFNYMKKNASSNMESFFFKRHTAVHLKKVYGLTNGVVGKMQSYSLMGPPTPEVY